MREPIPGEIKDIEVWRKVIQAVEWNSDFTIVLGNDPWLFGKKLVEVFGRPSAVFTTAIPKGSFGPMTPSTRTILEGLGNFSVGYDFPGSKVRYYESANHKKARDAWLCMQEIRQRYESAEVELYLSCTLYRQNVCYIEDLYEDAVRLGANLSFNFLNYDVDGGFDFFPGLEVLQDWLVTEEQFERVRQFVLSVPKDRFYIWEPFEAFDFKQMTRMGWHCKGNPYGGPTVDADGHLRCCGYRRGTHTPQLTWKHLLSAEGYRLWEDSVRKDAAKCPGCSWSCPMSWSIRGVRKKDLQWAAGKTAPSQG